MSWQTPDGDPPPESAAPQPDASVPDPTVPDPDAQTARVPIEGETPAEPAAPPANDAPAPPPAGIVSAQPTGWGSPAQDTAGGAQPDAPLVAWAAPAVPTVVPVPGAEGLVIAGVFSRVVAYAADGLLLGAINVAINGLLGLYDTDRDGAQALIVNVVLIGIDFLYFVGLWTSGLRATLGMRLLGLRVLGAATAGPLSINDAVLRWLALTGAIAIIALVPGIGPYFGFVVIVWILALLITTSTHPLHQGLHDRWARSVVVQPAPGGSGAAFATCLVLIVLVGIVLPVAIYLLAADQIQDILSKIGDSI